MDEAKIVCLQEAPFGERINGKLISRIALPTLLTRPTETRLGTYFEAASFLGAVPVLVGISSEMRAFFTWE